MHDKMPTDENIQKHGCTVVSVCVLCMRNFETLDHLFLHCSFVAHLWNWLGDMLHRTIDTTIVLCTLSCTPVKDNSQIKDLFFSGIIHTFHTVWLVRNSIRFNGLHASLLAAKAKYPPW